MQRKIFTTLIPICLLTGCNYEPKEQSHTHFYSKNKVENIILSQSNITILTVDKLAIDAPGITQNNKTSIGHISSNFGHAAIDLSSGQIIFNPYNQKRQDKYTDILSSPNFQAIHHNYQFKINYQVEQQHYQLTGSALPLFRNSTGQIQSRFTKLDYQGTRLSRDEQIMIRKKSDWSCVDDASTGLTWQVPQANGDFAFDTTYYWGDREINHRDFAQASCHLNTTCNTDHLIKAANQQQLCRHSDWRLPTRAEWLSILEVKLVDSESYLSPIDSFYFPYLDANYDQAYWTSSFVKYPNGYDSPAVEGDWQGSNATVGDAKVMWMSDDFALENMPPRSTNEPHVSLLVRGKMITDENNDTIESITVALPPESRQDHHEDNNWQKRFIKRGTLGQPLQNQDALDWQCTEDTFYADTLPNTQILWQRISPSGPLFSYHQAQAYIDEINQNTLCGRKDWRLPTETELKSILVESPSPSIDWPSLRAGYVNTIFNDTVVEYDSFYWTQTADGYSPENKKIAVAFQDAWSESSSAEHEHLYRIRLISTSRGQ
ncbi:DUF1566 domain-containing protein [Vibrio salilacus]|uniref:Lcl domain-containing protein n=1 Tax=Vibrio salilacus TaxID=1323749 RepID=UPI001FE6D358|nr:DUF1566 domain-containing protein [Vibrio salilacus]